MHGYFKMLTEGYRTRDAHLLQWFSRLESSRREIVIASRPEPFPRRSLHLLARRTEKPLIGTVDLAPQVLAFPNMRDPKRWWLDSVHHYRLPRGRSRRTIVWNPTIALSDDIMRSIAQQGSELHVDLLDDWTLHGALESIWPDMERAYGRLLSAASSVTANSEGTMALAERFGRRDAVLTPNGCDPERFSQDSTASGRVVVGYLGKIGDRLDAKLIVETAREHPNLDFWFAGPVLERSYNEYLAGAPNIRMLGDVPYREVPALLQKFDIGWVPHGVESGQVGGDAIKIYEYRAAGLPVLTTPIIGTRERPMNAVTVLDGSAHAAEIGRLVGGRERVPRVSGEIPVHMTWRHKAESVLRAVGIDTSQRGAEAR